MKKYMKPVMVIVKIKPHHMIAQSGGVNTGGKVGNVFNSADQTYSRSFSFDDEEDE